MVGAFVSMSLVVVFAVLLYVFWVAGAWLLGGGNCGGGRGWAFPATRREIKKNILAFFLLVQGHLVNINLRFMHSSP